MTTVFINSHELKLYLIAALLITIVLLIDDLIRHPAPDAVWVDTPDGIQLRFTHHDPQHREWVLAPDYSTHPHPQRISQQTRYHSPAILPLNATDN